MKPSVAWLIVVAFSTPAIVGSCSPPRTSTPEVASQALWKELTSEDWTSVNAARQELGAASKAEILRALHDCASVEDESEESRLRKGGASVAILDAGRAAGIGLMDLFAEAFERTTDDQLASNMLAWVGREASMSSDTACPTALLAAATRHAAAGERSEPVQIALAWLAGDCCSNIAFRYAEFQAKSDLERTAEDAAQLESALAAVRAWIPVVAAKLADDGRPQLQRIAVIELRPLHGLHASKAVDVTAVFAPLRAICADRGRATEVRLSAAFELDSFGEDSRERIETLRRELEVESQERDREE